MSFMSLCLFVSLSHCQKGREKGRGVKMLQTYRQKTYRHQTYRPSDEAGPRGAFAPNNGSFLNFS